MVSKFDDTVNDKLKRNVYITHIYYLLIILQFHLIVFYD